MSKILIIDDDQNICLYFSAVIKERGHDVRHELTFSGGRAAMSSNKFDVVFLDVHLPDGNGLELLSEIRGQTDAPEVVIITGFGDPKGAALAINNDAWDYVEKPASPDKLVLSLNRALQFRESKKYHASSRALNIRDIVGNSFRMESCLESVAVAADTNASVLITGETGSGKELVAGAIHKNSNRSKNKFVIVDCASFPESLAESILFGHEKGAFTGADRARTGLVKLADKGTLFLDEVGEMPLSIQKKFLRVLETKRFRPIGERTELNSDFRLLAATHRNLNELVQKNEFREDLLYRLRSIEIEVPALREHKEDIKELSIYHMNRICDKHGVACKVFDPEVFIELESYDWPQRTAKWVDEYFSGKRYAVSIRPFR